MKLVCPLHRKLHKSNEDPWCCESISQGLGMYDQCDSLLIFGGYCIDMPLHASIKVKLPVILVMYRLYHLIVYKKW